MNGTEMFGKRVRGFGKREARSKKQEACMHVCERKGRERDKRQKVGAAPRGEASHCTKRRTSDTRSEKISLFLCLLPNDFLGRDTHPVPSNQGECRITQWLKRWGEAGRAPAASATRSRSDGALMGHVSIVTSCLAASCCSVGDQQADMSGSGMWKKVLLLYYSILGLQLKRAGAKTSGRFSSIITCPGKIGNRSGKKSLAFFP